MNAVWARARRSRARCSASGCVTANAASSFWKSGRTPSRDSGASAEPVETERGRQPPGEDRAARREPDEIAADAGDAQAVVGERRRDWGEDVDALLLRIEGGLPVEGEGARADQGIAQPGGGAREG